jgi:hypothetical protein
MRQTIAVAALLLVAPAGWGGQVATQVIAPQGFAAEFPAGGLLQVRLRSGDVKIVGGAENRIAVRYEGANADRGHEVAVSLDRKAQGGGRLSIDGGPRDHLRIIVEVPRQLNLDVRMPAGSLAISGITGDKTIGLHAGEVLVEVGAPEQYAHVDASVMAGEISARPFGVDKGGLFRSFEMSGKGPYRLNAHLFAGDLTFRN